MLVIRNWSWWQSVCESTQINSNVCCPDLLRLTDLTYPSLKVVWKSFLHQTLPWYPSLEEILNTSWYQSLERLTMQMISFAIPIFYTLFDHPVPLLRINERIGRQMVLVWIPRITFVQHRINHFVEPTVRIKTNISFPILRREKGRARMESAVRRWKESIVQIWKGMDRQAREGDTVYGELGQLEDLIGGTSRIVVKNFIFICADGGTPSPERLAGWPKMFRHW